MRELRYTHTGEPCSVKTVLQNHFHLSKASVTSLKNEGGMSVKGENVTVRRVLNDGDELLLRFVDKESKIIPAEMNLDILYEDEDILAVNKPSGIPTHPSKGHFTDTLANGIAYRYRNENFIFRAVNRLDRETSGIVLVAKNKNSAHKLGEQLKEKEVKKTYYAVLYGTLPDETGEIEASIARIGESMKRGVNPNGKYALTRYRVIRSDGNYSLVEVSPVTGRTHQIRVHFSYIGCPILGDSLYGKSDERLFLHCGKMSFKHPVSGENITLLCPVDDAFYKKIQKN